MIVAASERGRAAIDLVFDRSELIAALEIFHRDKTSLIVYLILQNDNYSC
jgi:hypothetical protein